MTQSTNPNEKTSLASLRALATELGVKSVTKYKKAELLEIVNEKLSAKDTSKNKIIKVKREMREEKGDRYEFHIFIT